MHSVCQGRRLGLGAQEAPSCTRTSPGPLLGLASALEFGQFPIQILGQVHWQARVCRLLDVVLKQRDTIVLWSLGPCNLNQLRRRHDGDESAASRQSPARHLTGEQKRKARSSTKRRPPPGRGAGAENARGVNPNLRTATHLGIRGDKSCAFSAAGGGKAGENNRGRKGSMKEFGSVMSHECCPNTAHTSACCRSNLNSSSPKRLAKFLATEKVFVRATQKVAKSSHVLEASSSSDLIISGL